MMSPSGAAALTQIIMPMGPRYPRLIPVLDVMHGQVVRAVGGKRKEYRPLTSKLVQSTDPQTVATALLNATGAEELYLADLDAIQGQTQPRFEVRKLLETVTVPVWLDGGFGDGQALPSSCELPLVRPVIGFETCKTPGYLREILQCSHHAPRDVLITRSVMTTLKDLAFSIDMRDGELIGDWRAWGLRDSRDSLGLARSVAQVGCCRLIVLDLARVGTGSGCGTDDLLRTIRAEFPEIELMAGGGVKSWEDIDHLGACGVDAVLVASALHDGHITLPRLVYPSPRP
jgi:phosphoribosylformimino-5-aminoimidazole carboxamide ribotide isomerase